MLDCNWVNPKTETLFQFPNTVQSWCFHEQHCRLVTFGVCIQRAGFPLFTVFVAFVWQSNSATTGLAEYYSALSCFQKNTGTECAYLSQVLSSQQCQTVSSHILLIFCRCNCGRRKVGIAIVKLSSRFKTAGYSEAKRKSQSSAPFPLMTTFMLLPNWN